MADNTDTLLSNIIRRSAIPLLTPAIQRRPITRVEAAEKYGIGAGNKRSPGFLLADAHEQATFEARSSADIDTVSGGDTGEQPKRAVPHGVCKAFYETGFCRFGDSCRFSHVRAADL